MPSGCPEPLPHHASVFRSVHDGALPCHMSNTDGLGIGLGTPTDALGGVGIGFIAGGSLLLLFGSSAGYPRGPRLQADLAALGVQVGELTPAPIQSWGAHSLLGQDVDGRPLLVKVYGRDARNAQFFAKAWRSLWYN